MTEDQETKRLEAEYDQIRNRFAGRSYSPDAYGRLLELEAKLGIEVITSTPALWLR